MVAAMERKKMLSVLFMMMLSEDIREFVDKNGGHDSGCQKETKRCLPVLY